MSLEQFADLSFKSTDSFEQLSTVTQSLLTHICNQDLQAAETQSIIVQLLKADKGPRAFFATLLTDERAIADQPPPELIAALDQMPEITADLLVKNLAMSTAMRVHHGRQNNGALAQSSQQVQSRSQQLLVTLTHPAITQSLEEMRASLQGHGNYTAFLSRWGYDAEQQQSIANCVEETINRFPEAS